MQLVTFDPATGLAISTQPITAGVLVTDDNGPINDAGQRLALVDGAVTRVWDLRGWGAFGGADGRTPIDVPEGLDTIGKSWADLALMTSAENPHGLLKDPRPETNAERTAREAAEAQAAAAAEDAARLNAKVSMAQFRKALLQIGLLDDVEAVMAAPDTPAAIKIDWEYATEVRRAWPAWAAFLPLIDKTEADLDAVFALAATL